jgi:hypothetical protein
LDDRAEDQTTLWTQPELAVGKGDQLAVGLSDLVWACLLKAPREGNETDDNCRWKPIPILLKREGKNQAGKATSCL